MSMRYRNPNRDLSTIDRNTNKATGQILTTVFERKALIEAQEDKFFSPLASSLGMPLNMGKTITRYAYIPLLDDRNVNDQGIDASGVKIANGNLYGSSRDIGTILDKIPELKETGGRVNRVGFSRTVREGSIKKIGFFYDFTNESGMFDSDTSMWEHIYNEAVKGITKVLEDLLQIDLLTNAGVTLYGGGATRDEEVTAEGATPSFVNMGLFYRADRKLTANRCPKHTKIITGSNKIDTVTLPSCRIAYTGPEVVQELRELVDQQGNPVFTPVEKYAYNGQVLNGEVGRIHSFRIVEVPDMIRWEGAGAQVQNDLGYASTNGKYDVFPVLIVGDDAFNTLVLQSNRGGKNFEIIRKMPGSENASMSDPYGENGFVSLKAYYGFLCNRPERICMLKVVAKR